MPIRLIATIILMSLVALFTGKNWGNSCEVWPISSLTGLGNIQVSIIIIVSFILGVLVTLPFTIIRKKPRKKEEKVEVPLVSEKKPKKTKTGWGKKKKAGEVSAPIEMEGNALEPR